MLTLRQHELSLGVIINDCDCYGSTSPALPLPFRDEHRSDLIAKITRRHDRSDKRLNFLTADLLRGCESMIEEGTAGVGIDFDQARAVGREVEIIAHEGTNRAKIRN